jgi:hypothetical protein
MTHDKRRGPSNVAMLVAAGVIEEGLPDEYHVVFEDLSDEELGVIMQLKARLDATKMSVPGIEDYAHFVPP